MEQRPKQPDGELLFQSTNECRVQAKNVSSSTNPESGNTNSEDTYYLSRLGKFPILRRTFGFMSICGFTCTILCSWEGVSLIFAIPITHGGPAGFVYGTILVWLGMLTVYASLAELVSMAPTAGGQYHWVAMLAPPRYHRFMSYIAGWLTVIGWQAIVATAVIAAAQVVQGLVKLNHPSYSQPAWHQLFIYWAMLAFAVLINVLASTVLPRFEAIILIFHIFGFFAILVPLLVLGDFQKPYDVFGLWLNEDGYESQGLSWLVGLLGQVFLFVGADGAVHMSEEIENAAMVVPWSILVSVTLNGILAFVILLTMLSVATDLSAALDSNTGIAFLEVFRNATGSNTGAAVMASLITSLQLFAVVACLAGCSRMTWSFARDRGLPGYKWLQKVDLRTSIPVNTVLTSSIVSVVISLIILASTTAFTNIISISFCGLFMSYWLVVSLVLWRRLTGGIHNAATSDSSGIINTPGHELVWGPWRMGLVLGTFVNSTALAFLTLVIFFMFWPPTLPVTPSNMNYDIVVVGGVLLFSMVWYAVSARKVYTGPIIEHTTPRIASVAC